LRDYILKVQTAGAGCPGSDGHSRRYGVTASGSRARVSGVPYSPVDPHDTQHRRALLILRQAPPLSIQTDPQAADRVAEKMAQLQMAVQASQPHAVILNEAELNQWMRDNLAIASAHQAQQAGIPAPNESEPSVQEVQSALKDVRMNLMGNQLRAYALFALYGKEISLQLDGKIETQRGYIRLKPTSGKLGSLPIPSTMLNYVGHQLFGSPQNRDKFQLPPQIESIRIENNTLVIATR
jgi:hypothetical protein